jgi:hypothetical protein
MTWRIVLLALAACSQARADTGPSPPPVEACRKAIVAAERAHGIPTHLLAAIARVESGRRDAVSGTFNPWPWTINFDGQGSFYDNKAQAVAAAKSMRPRATKSVDAGCMQISLTHHPDAFASLDQAFDPAANADYGARFLMELFEKTGSWPKAVGLYHSGTPELAADYQMKVYAALPLEQRLASAAGPAGLGGSPLAPGWNRTPFPAILPQATPHIIPNGGAARGKTLDAYRSMAVRFASLPR